ncbi:uncharacterized protein EbC_40860 [Erwinia billingiae Eb661]|uniref:Uncharacterized protein n=1 Tax=Erwinia billingiae (strain Eb661) TaxID=634500 RepID=D8MXR0_ERWBE|nr:uncharacterized protein EbC_40860 [Erwinia billingiae Eb661]
MFNARCGALFLSVAEAIHDTAKVMPKLQSPEFVGKVC